jgi:hypothetical protein
MISKRLSVGVLAATLVLGGGASVAYAETGTANNVDNGAVANIDNGAVNNVDDGAVANVDNGAVNNVDDGQVG